MVSERIDNLLDFVHAGDRGQAIRERLMMVEKELEAINRRLDSLSDDGEHILDVSIYDIADMLTDVLARCGEKSPKTVELNQTLKRIVDEPLAVSYSEASREILYNVKGELKAFAGLQLPTFPTSGSGTPLPTYMEVDGPDQYHIFVHKNCAFKEWVIAHKPENCQDGSCPKGLDDVLPNRVDY